MGQGVKARLGMARLILRYLWVKIGLGLWGIIGVYDLLLSQIIPDEVGKRFPRVRHVMSMTSGWLPWWAWLLGFAVIAVAASFEYAFRLTLIVRGKESDYTGFEAKTSEIRRQNEREKEEREAARLKFSREGDKAAATILGDLLGIKKPRAAINPLAESRPSPRPPALPGEK